MNPKLKRTLMVLAAAAIGAVAAVSPEARHAVHEFLYLVGQGLDSTP